MPRIGIDYTPAYEQGGGIGRYVRELVSALTFIDTDTDYRLFVSGVHEQKLPQSLAENFIWKPTKISPQWFARLWHRTRLPFPVELFTGQLDLFHATDFVLPPTLPTTKTLLTVHDLSFVKVPETASPSLKSYLDKVVPRSVKQATHVLADSQATKNDLIELYKTPEDKITVLLSGVDERFIPVIDIDLLNQVRQKYELNDKKYILSVGTVQPRKNYSRVIRSLSQLRQQGLDIHYAIAGGKGWLEDEMYQTIDETNMRDYVHLLGFVDDEDLPALYTSSELLIITSLYEGFGLPILEAMACGIPVITSNLSSLPEVAGDAAILINPLDTHTITDAVYTLLTDTPKYSTLAAMGHQQAQKFSWEKSAIHLKSIYDSLLNS